MSGIEVRGWRRQGTSAFSDAVYLIRSTFSHTFLSASFFVQKYGLSGCAICVFGSREIWRIQVQILGSTKDSDAMDFKKSAQDDSNIIAVASTILAQVAITALSLENLSSAHWVARAFFTFSLVSSIMAVYYATSQYRILGRCLGTEQVKRWIQGSNPVYRHDVPLRTLVVLPSAAAVLTMSAPNMLLSSSLNAFVIGLGVYLGYVWTRNLDEQAGAMGSHGVFITYIVGLGVCYFVYALSRLIIADQSYVSEREWVRKYPATDFRPIRMITAADVIGPCSTQTPPEQDEERATSQNAISKSTNGDARHRSMMHDEDTRKELLVLFQEAADMRKASAKVDERLARLLERLGEETLEVLDDLSVRME